MNMRAGVDARSNHLCASSISSVSMVSTLQHGAERVLSEKHFLYAMGDVVRALLAIGNYRAVLFAWSHAFSPWTKIMVE